jgi:SAM-dependent methyltransferase
MTLGFSGEVATYYAKFRRDYPPAVLDALQAASALTAQDVVLDLGCGTGQLAVPLASRARSVVGMDPEPDMLRLAGESAARRGVRNVTWVLGSDADVPGLGTLVGKGSLAMTVIGQALHWMRHDDLFRDLAPLFRAGGGIAVVSPSRSMTGPPAIAGSTPGSIVQSATIAALAALPVLCSTNTARPTGSERSR